MRKLLSVLLCVLMLLSVIPIASIGEFGVAAAGGEEVVYLKGTSSSGSFSGDGSSADPYNNIHSAIDHIVEKCKDGIIVVCGSYTQTYAVKPAHNSKLADKANKYKNYTGKITITSVYGGNDYGASNGAAFEIGGQYFVLNCDVEFNNIKITSHKGNRVLFIAQGHHLTIGDGVVMDGNDAFKEAESLSSGGLIIIGGYADNESGLNSSNGYDGANTGVDAANDCNVTVKSGSSIHIIAYNYYLSGASGNARYLGNNSAASNITVCGTAKVARIYCGSVYDKNKPEYGDVNLTVDGDVIIGMILGSYYSATLNNLNIVWKNGTVNANCSLLRPAGAGNECTYNHVSFKYSDRIALTSKVPYESLNGIRQDTWKAYFPDIKESIIPTLLSAGLTLDGKIGVNFKLAKVDGLGNGQTIKTKIGDEDEIDHDLIVSEGSYVFSHYVAAKQMTDEITVTYSAPNASNASKKSIEYTYSVKEYADTIIANEGEAFSPELVDLAKAMLTYGRYTQLYAGYNTEKLATATPNVVSGVTVDAENKAIKASNLNIGSVVGANLVLLDDTTFKVYVELNGGVDKNTLTFTVGTTPVEAVEEDGYYVIYINGIDAGKLSNKYDIKVSNGVDTILFNANALSYCHAALSSENAEHTEALKNVVRALVAYDDAALKYDNAN